jgi:2-polyprenyl-6-methoxyphenol hydroxylase-like FAD-dependent oxidoreductase
MLPVSLFDLSITPYHLSKLTNHSKIDAMPPFRGEGGCQAVDDALKLARAIEAMDKADVSSIKTFMDSYQREMLERGSKAAKLSADVLKDNLDPSERVVGGQRVQILPRDKVII